MNALRALKMACLASALAAAPLASSAAVVSFTTEFSGSGATCANTTCATTSLVQNGSNVDFVLTPNLTGGEFITGLYSNWDPFQFATSHFSFSNDGGTGESAAQSLSAGEDQFKADGDGYFDWVFNFNTSGQPGGFADFDNFKVDEPRAWGMERRIPVGKTITLASGADGSFLAADNQNMSLVNVAADASGSAARNIRFKVVDLGKGRAALKAGNGRFVSAAGESVVLKDLAGKAPGDPESFQWINLMRGDTMLMSLTNHRYLATKPNNPGPVTVSATGPRPDRKDGACFKWKEAK